MEAAFPDEPFVGQVRVDARGHQESTPWGAMRADCAAAQSFDAQRRVTTRRSTWAELAIARVLAIDVRQYAH